MLDQLNTMTFNL